jgi:DNA-binding LytR/AlgR family response regulator
MLVFSLLNNYYKNNSSLITINLHGRKTNIKINTILYLETEGHHTSIITIDNIYTYRCTMKKLLEMMNSNSFIQIQKSIAVNLDFVKEIDESNNIILNNGNIFSINRHYKQEVLNKYKDYLLL